MFYASNKTALDYLVEFSATPHHALKRELEEQAVLSLPSHTLCHLERVLYHQTIP
jgi:hypothetical protein